MEKRYYYAVLMACTLFSSCECTKTGGSNTLIGDWKKTDDFEGLARSEAVSFTIGGKAYVCTGATKLDQLNDLWEYDAAGRFWTQRADFPGPARSRAIAFTIGGKGYVGTGFDGLTRFNDIWEYDPQSDHWEQKASLPAEPRYDAVAFGVNSKGYIACGYNNNYLRDCWEFTPGNNPGDLGTWQHKASVGGSKRAAAMAFVVSNTAYVMGGENNGEIQQDLWSFDPVKNEWNEKAKLYNATSDAFDDGYTSIARQNGVAIVIGTRVYIATGEKGGYVANTWEYNPAADRWTEKTAFESTPRTGACHFTLNDHGFLLTGRSSTLVMDNAFEFLPDANKSDND
ncbi:MAG: galactose oxidase [Bacteroidetes bacterium]|nr:galactose oxidase [Bacteroidota bacterium]